MYRESHKHQNSGPWQVVLFGMTIASFIYKLQPKSMAQRHKWQCCAFQSGKGEKAGHSSSDHDMAQGWLRQSQSSSSGVIGLTGALMPVIWQLRLLPRPWFGLSRHSWQLSRIQHAGPECSTVLQCTWHIASNWTCQAKDAHACLRWVELSDLHQLGYSMSALTMEASYV